MSKPMISPQELHKWGTIALTEVQQFNLDG